MTNDSTETFSESCINLLQNAGLVVDFTKMTSWWWSFGHQSYSFVVWQKKQQMFIACVELRS